MGPSHPSRPKEEVYGWSRILGGMDDREILSRIHTLVDAEDELHAKAVDHTLSHEERARLRDIDEQLDQCWDLLRQRRARREFGENPDEARARPIDTVEHYEQ
jgi:hypothetical protein